MISLSMCYDVPREVLPQIAGRTGMPIVCMVVLDVNAQELCLGCRPSAVGNGATG